MIQVYKNENSNFSDIVYWSKNTYLSFSVWDNTENILYSYTINTNCKNILNSCQTYSNCENIYMSNYVTNSEKLNSKCIK